MQYKVKVWSETVEVETYQKSKSVWIASGTYLGETFQLKDRSSTAAAAAWRKAAEYRGG
jgi:hypothetical protein